MWQPPSCLPRMGDAVADLGWEADVKASLHECHTVGYIIDETKDAICVAATWSRL